MVPIISSSIYAVYSLYIILLNIFGESFFEQITNLWSYFLILAKKNIKASDEFPMKEDIVINNTRDLYIFKNLKIESIQRVKNSLVLDFKRTETGMDQIAEVISNAVSISYANQISIDLQETYLTTAQLIELLKGVKRNRNTSMLSLNASFNQDVFEAKRELQVFKKQNWNQLLKSIKQIRI